MILKVSQPATFCLVYLGVGFDYEINAASLVASVHVLTGLFCGGTNTLPLYLHRPASIAGLEAALASRGVVCTQRSLKCSPVFEVLC